MQKFHSSLPYLFSFYFFFHYPPHSFFISSWNLFFSEFLSVAITSFLFQNLGQKKKRKRKKRSFLINIDRHSILYRSILYYRRYLLMQNRLDIPRLDSPVRCQPLQSFLCTPATKNPPDESRKIRRSRKVPTFQTTNALQECIYIYIHIFERCSTNFCFVRNYRSLFTNVCNYLSTAMTQASRTRPALNPSSSTVNNFKKRLVARTTF